MTFELFNNLMTMKLPKSVETFKMSEALKAALPAAEIGRFLALKRRVIDCVQRNRNAAQEIFGEVIRLRSEWSVAVGYDNLLGDIGLELAIMEELFQDATTLGTLSPDLRYKFKLEMEE